MVCSYLMSFYWYFFNFVLSFNCINSRTLFSKCGDRKELTIIFCYFMQMRPTWSSALLHFSAILWYFNSFSFVSFSRNIVSYQNSSTNIDLMRSATIGKKKLPEVIERNSRQWSLSMSFLSLVFVLFIPPSRFHSNSLHAFVYLY